MNRINAILLLAIFHWQPDVVYAEEKNTIPPVQLGKEESVVLQQIEDQLKQAIQAKDFTRMRLRPVSESLEWRRCEKGSPVESLSFETMVKRLSEMSRTGKILVNRMPDQQLAVTVVETKGWGSKSSYLYFNFEGGRWTGVYSCGTRDDDIARIRGTEMSDSEVFNGTTTDDSDDWLALVQNIWNVLETKNFTLLRIYLPKGPTVNSGDCGPGDSGPEYLAIDSAQKLLFRQLNNSSIQFNSPPNTEVDLKSGHVFIETEGWVGEYPYLGFNFDFLISGNIWAWTGFCYSSTPRLDTRLGAKYEPVYVRIPSLPRPGPRIFKNKYALRDRLQEIVRFKKFDAFKVYAVKPILALGLCQGDAKQKRFAIKGHAVPIADVVEFLNTSAVKYPVSESSGVVGDLIEDARSLFQSKPAAEQPGRYHGTPGTPIFESKITGAFPYVLFWADESKDGWLWSGVSYCKVPHQSLLFPDDPRYKQDKNK